MNNYIPNYTDIVTNVCRMNDPKTTWTCKALLADLRDEIVDLKPEAERFDNAYGVALMDIIIKKINRKIDFIERSEHDIINS